MKTIRELRVEKQYTLQKVAESAGVAIGTVRNWENLVFRPNDDRLRDLAELFEVPVPFIKIADKKMKGFPPGSRIVNGRVIRPGEDGWY